MAEEKSVVISWIITNLCLTAVFHGRAFTRRRGAEFRVAVTLACGVATWCVLLNEAGDTVLLPNVVKLYALTILILDSADSSLCIVVSISPLYSAASDFNAKSPDDACRFSLICFLGMLKTQVHKHFHEFYCIHHSSATQQHCDGLVYCTVYIAYRRQCSSSVLVFLTMTCTKAAEPDLAFIIFYHVITA